MRIFLLDASTFFGFEVSKLPVAIRLVLSEHASITKLVLSLQHTNTFPTIILVKSLVLFTCVKVNQMSITMFHAVLILTFIEIHLLQIVKASSFFMSVTKSALEDGTLRCHLECFSVFGTVFEMA